VDVCHFKVSRVTVKIPGGAQRMSHIGHHVSRGLVGLLATLTLAAAASVAGLAAPAARTTEADSVSPPLPPPPAAPAFHTIAAGRLQAVGPDEFTLTLSRLKPPIRMRLADATSEGLDAKQRELGQALTTQLIDAEPVWVFPASTGGTRDDAVWEVRVWTRKGWLSDVLVRAHYAKREVTAAEDLTPPSADQVPAAGDDVRPCGPAFVGTRPRALTADVLEVMRDGKFRQVRLCDVAAANDSGEPDPELQKKVAACLGSGPVWVFPDTSVRVKTGEAMPGRVWTARGEWLSDRLVKEGLATQVVEADDTAPEPPTNDSATTNDPPPKPTSLVKPKYVWREVPVEEEELENALMCGSKAFKITSPVWRLSWDMKSVRRGASVFVNLFRVDDQWEVRQSSTVLCGMKGSRGSKILHTGPGQYWVQVTNSVHLNIKVEEQQPIQDGE